MRPSRPRMPDWIRVRVAPGNARNEVDGLIRSLGLNTVCSSAGCPNLGECWHSRTATFMIMGDACTRNCKFCRVGHQPDPLPPDPDEATKVAEASERLGLKYVVVTSVTRDDLAHGGAECFASVIHELRARIPGVKVEVLTPDFNADPIALQMVADARPDVFNHNLETVERMTPQIRSRATYRQSLQVLRWMADHGQGIPVKSGIMVGVGENDQEVEQALRDLRESGCTLLTIGQYLPPSAEHFPLHRYVEPETFNSWKALALSLGFEQVASGPLVRSSYHAHELAEGRCQPES